MLCEACHHGLAIEAVKGIAEEVWSEFKWQIVTGFVLFSTILFFVGRFLIHHIRVI